MPYAGMNRPAILYTYLVLLLLVISHTQQQNITLCFHKTSTRKTVTHGPEPTATILIRENQGTWGTF